MKYLFLGFFVFALGSSSGIKQPAPVTAPAADTALNIFIITLDGFRWQELFKGADSNILANSHFTADAEMMKSMFWDADENERRKKLMPFMWSMAAAKGQIFGNRKYGNDVDVSNLYNISYAGYNEMFTGTTDLSIFSNDKKNNRNKNIFEYLSRKDSYRNKIALFTSWDVFPYILNEKRSGLEINSGYENVREENNTLKTLNTVQEMAQGEKQTRNDMLTFIAAKEYLQLHQPKLFYLGLGETDEYAHRGNYDMYLQKANEADRIIGQLWHWAQTTEGYKNNTLFIITTDHGRGKRSSEWTSHGTFVQGSSQTWMVMLGKGIAAEGEIKTPGEIRQKQLAQTIANLLGEEFGREQPINFIAAKN